MVSLSENILRFKGNEHLSNWLYMQFERTLMFQCEKEVTGK